MISERQLDMNFLQEVGITNKNVGGFPRTLLGDDGKRRSRRLLKAGLIESRPIISGNINRTEYFLTFRGETILGKDKL